MVQLLSDGAPCALLLMVDTRPWVDIFCTEMLLAGVESLLTQRSLAVAILNIATVAAVFERRKDAAVRCLSLPIDRSQSVRTNQRDK